MKFNFGHGIFIVILLFMAGISFLVYKCSQQKVDLVNPKYYEQELKYEEQISKEKKALALNEKVGITFNAPSREVVIAYPSSLDGAKISGEILFFKPDNNDFDFTLPVKSDVNHIQQINATKMQQGLWRIKVNWIFGSTNYYSEERIFIN